MAEIAAIENTEQVEELVRHPLQMNAKVQLLDDYPGLASSLAVSVKKIDMLTKQIVLAFRAYALRKSQPAQSVTVRTPTSWFQMFKRDVIPFVTRWSPVKYTERKIEVQGITFICPHLDAPEETHLDFLSLGGAQ